MHCRCEVQLPPGQGGGSLCFFKKRTPLLSFFLSFPLPSLPPFSLFLSPRGWIRHRLRPGCTSKPKRRHLMPKPAGETNMASRPRGGPHHQAGAQEERSTCTGADRDLLRRISTKGAAGQKLPAPRTPHDLSAKQATAVTRRGLPARIRTTRQPGQRRTRGCT